MSCLLLEGDGCLGNLCSTCTEVLAAEREARERAEREFLAAVMERDEWALKTQQADMELAAEQQAHAETRRELAAIERWLGEAER